MSSSHISLNVAVKSDNSSLMKCFLSLTLLGIRNALLGRAPLLGFGLEFLLRKRAPKKPSFLATSSMGLSSSSTSLCESGKRPGGSTEFRVASRNLRIGELEKCAIGRMQTIKTAAVLNTQVMR